MLADNVQRLLEKWLDPIEAVGVAMPATLDSAGRVVAWPNRPAWAGVDLTSALRDMFPEAGAGCADDGDLAALAESNAANCANLVYLGVGTGIGGGLVLDGRSISDFEIGHAVVDRFGPECTCGRRGCLQAIASGPATLRRAADSRFAAAIQETYEALAVAAVSVAELVHPDVVVIGGGFAAAYPGFAGHVARAASELSRPGHPAPPVREAALGGLSSLHGAVLLARDLG